MAKRILVVDDDENILSLERTILEQKGFHVTTAGGGEDALKLLREQAFDLVLLDVMMPGMDGMQVLDAIRADPHLASLPVVLVTAKTEDQDLLNGYRAGAQYYVTKPFTSRQLLYAISLVLGAAKTG